MSKFEVQEYCLCGGWTNTWSYEEDGQRHSTKFASAEEAQAELDWFFKEMEEEVEDGNIEDFTDREDFRIVEVTA